MKTAISIPDETFEEAERRADALGRFTVAVRRYIEELDARSLTSRIDAAVDLVGEDESPGTAVSAAHRVLAADTSEW